MKVHTFQHLKYGRKWRRPTLGDWNPHTFLQNHKAQYVHFPELNLIVEEFEDRTELRYNATGGSGRQVILVIEKNESET